MKNPWFALLLVPALLTGCGDSTTEPPTGTPTPDEFRLRITLSVDGTPTWFPGGSWSLRTLSGLVVASGTFEDDTVVAMNLLRGTYVLNWREMIWHEDGVRWRMGPGDAVDTIVISGETEYAASANYRIRSGAIRVSASGFPSGQVPWALYDDAGNCVLCGQTLLPGETRVVDLLPLGEYRVWMQQYVAPLIGQYYYYHESNQPENRTYDLQARLEVPHFQATYSQWLRPVVFSLEGVPAGTSVGLSMVDVTRGYAVSGDLLAPEDVAYIGLRTWNQYWPDVEVDGVVYAPATRTTQLTVEPGLEPVAVEMTYAPRQE